MSVRRVLEPLEFDGLGDPPVKAGFDVAVPPALDDRRRHGEAGNPPVVGRRRREIGVLRGVLELPDHLGTRKTNRLWVSKKKIKGKSQDLSVAPGRFRLY